MLFLASFRAADGMDKSALSIGLLRSTQVPGEELLGSITSTQQGTITMQQPANETTLRSLRSAGSKSAALSGFSARALSIKRHIRPIRLVRPQVEDLIEIYRRRGFSRTELLQLSACVAFSSLKCTLSLSLSPSALGLVLQFALLSLSLFLLSLSLSLSLSRSDMSAFAADVFLVKLESTSSPRLQCSS